MVLAAASTSAGELFAKVLPLAVGAAISPTMLIVMLIVLSGRVHPKARGAAFAAGALAVFALLAVVGLTLLHHSVTKRSASDPIYGWIDLGFAVLLIGLGIRALVAPPNTKPPRADTTDTAAHLGRYFGLGIAMMLTNFSTLVLFLPAMKDITIADVGTGTKIVAVIVVIAIASVLVWVPLLLFAVAPGAADRILDPINGFMTRNQRAITIVVCFVFAVYLGIKGSRVL